MAFWAQKVSRAFKKQAPGDMKTTNICLTLRNKDYQFDGSVTMLERKDIVGDFASSMEFVVICSNLLCISLRWKMVITLISQMFFLSLCTLLLACYKTQWNTQNNQQIIGTFLPTFCCSVATQQD